MSRVRAAIIVVAAQTAQSLQQSAADERFLDDLYGACFQGLVRDVAIGNAREDYDGNINAPGSQLSQQSEAAHSR